MIVVVFELSFFVLIVCILYTQVIEPFVKGRAFFPLLRKESKLVKDLAEARQESHELDIEQDIANITLDNKRRKKKIKPSSSEE